MALSGVNYPTLQSIAAAMPGGTANEVAARTAVELQSQVNDIMNVLPLFPCNNGTREEILQRMALPEIAWRMMNKGVKPTKSAMQRASFSCGYAQALSKVDELVWKVNKYSDEYRMSEAKAHQFAMFNKMATTMFYGDEKKNPAGFTGLCAYYYKTGSDVWGKQVIKAGGSGSALTSIWVVCFGRETVYGIYPEGSKSGGYEYEDMGKQPVTDSDGGELYAYTSKFGWNMGLAVKDPRAVVRLCNIDTTDMNDDLISKLIEAVDQIENPDAGFTAIFCNRKVSTYLRKQVAAKDNMALRVDEFAGHKVTHYDTIPILRCDAITSTESALS